MKRPRPGGTSPPPRILRAAELAAVRGGDTPAQTATDDLWKWRKLVEDGPVTP